MRRKLAAVLKIWRRRHRFSIRQRLMCLVLICSLLPFAALEIFSAYGMYRVQDILSRRSYALGESAAGYTSRENYEQSIIRLRDILHIKTQHVREELEQIRLNTAALADQMTYIMQHEQEFLPRPLTYTRGQSVYVGTPYMFYSDDVKRGFTEAAWREMALAGNFIDVLSSASVAYADYMDMCYAGSAHGYALRVELKGNKGEELKFTPEFLQSYDPRQRLWYKAALTAQKPIFTDVYTNTKGRPCITCAAPYYDLHKVVGALGMDSDLHVLSEEISADVMGANGFNFAINSKGQLLFSSRQAGTLSMEDQGEDVRVVAGAMSRKWFAWESASSTAVVNLPIARLREALQSMIRGEIGTVQVSIDGEDYFLAFEPLNEVGWSLGMVVSHKDIYAPAEHSRWEVLTRMDDYNSMLRRLFLATAAASIILMSFGLFGLFSFSNDIAGRFVKPIHKLTDGVRAVAAGNLDKKPEIHTGDELEELADSFNTMTERLSGYIQSLTKATVERERIATELDVAKEIQESILPRDFPDEAGVGLYATMRTAKEVGGDFYDFYFLDKNRLIVTMADVSGKGIGAALFMVVAKTVLQNFVLTAPKEAEGDLAEIMRRTNERLAKNNEAMMFVTTFLGMLDLTDGRFVFVNGGHNPPLIYRAATGQYTYMQVDKNFVLGPMEGVDFKQQELTLAKGDRLFLYTDGVTEALNKAQELYGEARLQDTLSRLEVSSLADQKLIEAVQKNIDAYVGEAEQSDDITMMSITYQ